ncbi:SDR family oxidoreductase [Rhizobium sp. CECT 9324]|uniref:SDR family oxidoreductase n=1 Tax=Rhizobium sp. CECT 9324 TaxID=2845820 RepID=UPI001E3FA6FD|nr:SDR family oxidoreductase [Rhizobium sp. CECT 9324]CAH0342632.1 5-keto-D-gluconate 5-reductase [Rhizobium sp. CECT 9324]
MTKKPIALITGANKGLGKEVARQLGRLGMRVYLGSRDVERGQVAADGLTREGAEVVAIALDVTDDASIVAAARHIEDREGLLDVLVNNAGVLHRVPALESDAANMLATYDVNVFGTVRTIHAFQPLLQRSPHPRIVNITSTSASMTLTSDPATAFGQSDTIVAYASSKAAVTMTSLQYANAFRRHPSHEHIKINAATPGHIATDLNSHAGTRTVQQGAKIVVDLATLPDSGPSGGYVNENGPLPW